MTNEQRLRGLEQRRRTAAQLLGAGTPQAEVARRSVPSSRAIRREVTGNLEAHQNMGSGRGSRRNLELVYRHDAGDIRNRIGSQVLRRLSELQSHRDLARRLLLEKKK